MSVQVEVAGVLLEIGAVGFSPHEPITFKSGLKSPVYVDNRRLPFWPAQWRKVIDGFRRVIEEHQIAFDVLAGIETGGIPHSAALGYAMQKPSVFVRKAAKAHGTQSRVEGGSIIGRRVLLIEDLVTTGGSSLSGVMALRDEGAVVEDCLCISSYGFAEAGQAFQAAEVRLHSLTSFVVILDEALRRGTFDATAKAIVEDWLRDPYGWVARQALAG
jgi:orotate phosphoribosyltransferase